MHVFNTSTQEAEAGGFLSSRPVWSTEFQDTQGYTEKPRLETNPPPPQKKKTKKKKNQKTKKQNRTAFNTSPPASQSSQ